MSDSKKIDEGHNGVEFQSETLMERTGSVTKRNESKEKTKLLWALLIAHGAS